MPWILGLAIALVVMIAAVFARKRTAAPTSRRRPLPSLEELEAERSALVEKRAEAEKSGDEALAEELMLQIRTKEHWINRAKRGDDSWRDYYEKTSGKMLDEWGKTGSK